MASQREAFNFYRSYYDVFKELNDKDKLAFIEALLDKQFTGREPSQLKGMANFAYLSQKHSIDKQIKGWEDKTKSKLQPEEDPLTPPMARGAVRGESTPRQQEKEEGKEKEEEQTNKEKPLTEKEREQGFLNWFNRMKQEHCGTEGRFRTLSKTNLNNLKKLRDAFTMEEFEIAFVAMTKNKWVIDNDRVVPDHFLVNDNFQKYLNATPIEKKIDTDRIKDPRVEQMNAELERIKNGTYDSK